MQPPDLVPTTDQIDCRLTSLDIELLELLAEGRATRGYLARQTNEQASWVGKRLARLVDEDVLENPDRGLYELPWKYRRRGDRVVLVQPDDTAARIRDHLRDRHDLVPEEYQGRSENPLQSLCYVAAEAYYYARGKPDELNPKRLEWPDGSSHWFLQNGEYVIDLSLPEPDPWLPVDDAEGRMFPSHPYPSNRTMDVLESLDLAEPAVIPNE